jgi:apolipoprotein N-acyltransferase
VSYLFLVNYLTNLLVVVLGALFALSFSLPIAVAPWLTGALSIACLMAFFKLVQRRPQNAVQATLLFGVSWFSFGLCWLYISMNRYGNLPSPIAATGVLLVAFYLSAFYGIATFLVRRFSGNRQINLWLLASAWLLADMARGYLFSGFPWLAIGYAQIDTPLSHLAPYVGVYGISLYVLLFAAAGVYVLTTSETNKLALFTIGVLILSIAVASSIPVPSTRTSKTPVGVALLQGNVPQDFKFDRNRIADTMNAYTDAVEKAQAELIVLPETAWTTLWLNTPENIKQRLAEKAKKHTIVLGLPYVGSGLIANSIAVITKDATLGYRYDKHHLVPFGEYIPFGFDWFVRMMNLPLGNFDRGRLDQPPLALGQEKIAFNICYEDLFGEEIIEAVRNGATILVNTSNLAWFGDSHALYQHLQIARMRSIETARPMLRSTNTGTTAHIDIDGKVIAQLPTFALQTLAVNVVGTTGKTVYVTLGNMPVFLLSIAIAIAALFGRHLFKSATRL